MDELEMFLNLPDVKDIEEEVFVSERLGKFTVRAMTADEHSEYMSRCQSKLSKKGMKFDQSKFALLVVAGQTVKPNFASAELLKKAGCSTAAEFIKRKLKAGEISDLAETICNISGFGADEDINEDIEEAKN